MIPRVVKFSGGRSSGMLLVNMLKAGELDAARGDLVLFNNTSAEHFATYDFARKMKEITEKKYNIPFFWLEFCTYEDADVGLWKRFPAYRLANANPYHPRCNPNGYRHKGEVFEESVSHIAYLPNMMSRTCTQLLKIFPTNEFLADWWGGGLATPRLGHFDDSPKITDDEVMRLHVNNRGKTPREIFLQRKSFVRAQPHVRPSQNFADFTDADVCNAPAALADFVLGGKAQLYGEYAMEYDSYLGLRADEKHRFYRVKDRIKKASNGAGSQQPPGEEARAPLVAASITKEKVARFWRNRPFGINLELEESGLFSNCVFCPLKGRKKLEEIARKTRHERTAGPQSINWWRKMEAKYQRDLRKEERDIKNEAMVYVGFFGATRSAAYEQLKKRAKKPPVAKDEGAFSPVEFDIPCDCTD